jgi:hypothetical protein
MHNPHKLSCSPSPIVKKCYFMLVTLKACFTNQQRCGTKKFSQFHSTHHDLKCINIFHIQILKPTIPKVHIYIGFETLKVKCTQYGICSQAAFKNAIAMFFFFFRAGGQLFSGGFEKIPGGGKNFAEGLSPPGFDIPKSSWGGL